MSQTVSGSSNGTVTTDLAQLREDILRTRAELGQTVEALAAKADVRARVRESARSPVPWAVVLTAVAAVAVVVVLKRRFR